MEPYPRFGGFNAQPLPDERDLFAELPPEHQAILRSLEGMYEAKMMTMGRENHSVVSTLQAFGGGVRRDDDIYPTTVATESFIEAVSLITSMSDASPVTTEDREKLHKKIAPAAALISARGAHSMLARVSHATDVPINMLGENLRVIDWPAVTEGLITGFNNSLRPNTETTLTITDELRVQPIESHDVGAFVFRCADEYATQAAMLSASALLSGRKKTIMKVINTMYDVVSSTPANEVVPAINGGSVYVDENKQPMPFVDYAKTRVRRHAFAQARRFLEAFVDEKSVDYMSNAQYRILESAATEAVWRAFAMGDSNVITSGNILDIYPELQAGVAGPPVEFTPDIILDRPILAGSEGEGGHRTSDTSVAADVRKSVSSAYVDPERLAVLEEVKNWDPNAKSVGAVMGGPGTRRIRSEGGELVEDKYFGVVTPIYAKETNAIAGYGLVADSVVANRRKFVVYRSDVGGLPWEEVATMRRQDAMKVPGVRAFVHTKFGNKSTRETTEEKIFYLLTCTAEEYVTAQFDGEKNGKLRVRTGRTALKETVEPLEDSIDK